MVLRLMTSDRVLREEDIDLAQLPSCLQRRLTYLKAVAFGQEESENRQAFA